MPAVRVCSLLPPKHWMKQVIRERQPEPDPASRINAHFPKHKCVLDRLPSFLP
jgi:hypothetical protein